MGLLATWRWFPDPIRSDPNESAGPALGMPRLHGGFRSVPLRWGGLGGPGRLSAIFRDFAGIRRGFTVASGSVHRIELRVRQQT
jgi:hypothetical protein